MQGEGSSTSSNPNQKKWFIGTVVLGLICILLLVLTIVYAKKSMEPKSPMEASEEPSYSYCQTWEECTTTVEEFASVINHTDGFFGPACVGNNMMGRMITISGSLDTTFQPTKVRPSGRFAFAIGPDMLGRILAIGNNKATNIVRELGYGDNFVCGNATYNYTNCQYRLLIWAVPCPKNRPPLTQAFWENLEQFLRDNIYGDLTPNLTSAIATIRSAQGLLQTFTGCDPYVLNGVKGDFWNPTNQNNANCSQEFKDAMALFNNNKCNGTDPGNPNYINSTVGACPAEEAFLAIRNPTAIQLRAYLMQVEGFNPLYTGYGFTSNTDYYDPLQQEFWYPNEYITDLQSYTVLTIRNGTAFA